MEGYSSRRIIAALTVCDHPFSGRLSSRPTDGRTDGQTDKRTDVVQALLERQMKRSTAFGIRGEKENRSRLRIPSTTQPPQAPLIAKQSLDIGNWLVRFVARFVS